MFEAAPVESGVAFFKETGMTTQEIAQKLVALCRSGRNMDAVNNLLADDVESVEATGSDEMPATTNGKAGVRAKNEWWVSNHVVHHAEVRGPFPNEDRFAVIYDYEITPKQGPGAGQRMRMEEVAVYTVANDKIVREQFYYDMTGASALPPRKAAAAASKAAKKAKTKTKAKTKAQTKAKAKAAKKEKKAAKGKSTSKSKRR